MKTWHWLMICLVISLVSVFCGKEIQKRVNEEIEPTANIQEPTANIQEPTVKIPYKDGLNHIEDCENKPSEPYFNSPYRNCIWNSNIKELPLQEALQLIINTEKLKYVPTTKLKFEAYLTK